MSHAHHEYLFDFRYKDLETGKLDTDKLRTINSQSMANLIDREFQEVYCNNSASPRFYNAPHAYIGMEDIYNRYKFPDREKELEKQRKKEEREREKELERQRRRHQERKDYEERQKIAEKEFKERQEAEKRKQLLEIDEYRRRLQQREDELIKERQKRLASQYGSTGGQRIITSQWKVKQG